MIAIRFDRPNDCKSCCKYGWKMHKNAPKSLKTGPMIVLKMIFPWAHAFGPRPPTQSRALRLRHWRLNIRCIGNGYDHASVSYASVFLTQVYLNFRAIPPCKPKTSTYTTANIPEKLRKIDMPQVRITCIFMTTLFKSICLLHTTSRGTYYGSLQVPH